MKLPGVYIKLICREFLVSNDCFLFPFSKTEANIVTKWRKQGQQSPCLLNTTPLLS